ncbi:hypothetical protein Tco_0704416 [Tanacetum coccineum]|uniref:Uncharacterized protein n=1 Tax=Tanacetum coccineum TaxID=301880 RepID=A0ABQ4Y3F9_9ASTR
MDTELVEGIEGKLETLIETVKKQACEQQDQKKAIESTMSTCLYVGREEISLTPATITEMLNKKLQADH